MYIDQLEFFFPMTTQEIQIRLADMLASVKKVNQKADETIAGLTELGKEIKKIIEETESPKLGKKQNN